jgi:hypothetical protein
MGSDQRRLIAMVSVAASGSLWDPYQVGDF